MSASVREQPLDLDGSRFDHRREVFHGHRRNRRFAERVTVVRTVACGEAEFEQGDGRDPDEAALDARQPLVVDAAEVAQRGRVDEPGGHRHADAMTSGSARSAVRSLKRVSCSRVSAGPC